MFTCKVENSLGDLITLTQSESSYQITSITGLNPPKANINTSAGAGIDGSRFNSSRLTERNIVIILRINGDVENNRINLYRFFTPKNYCKFYYKNGVRDVYIEGYVESIECDLFSVSEMMQVSIICPNPYFRGIDEIIDDVSKVLAAFEFPFSISEAGIPFSGLEVSRETNVYNDSESKTGIIIELEIYGPVQQIDIQNTSTGQKFTLVYAFQGDDRIRINTNQGEKSIRLVRNAVESNIFPAIQRGSTFFQLAPGDNMFSYSADSGASDESVHVIFRRYTLYGGV